MKLRVNIEPGWFHGVHTVDVDLSDEDYGYLDMNDPQDKTYFNNSMEEIAQDIFNNEVSWGWEVVE